MTGLIADIGGTNARFALVEADRSISCVMQLQCDEYPSLANACAYYLAQVSPRSRLRRAALAVASPVTEDRVELTNNPWSFSIAETRRQLGLDRLEVINDFVAVALAVPHLGSADLMKIGGGERQPDAPVAILGAGTGLGMAGLIPTSAGWWPLTSEGGHMTLPASSDWEAEVVGLLRRRFDHVSAERVLSGPGLVNLYHALADLRGLTPDASLTPPSITERAVNESCPVCVETLAMFSDMFGTIASDLALTLAARGGVFIAGGIVPKLAIAFAASGFRHRFEDKGRFNAYLGSIPTYVITRELPALVGLASLVSS